MFVDVIKPQAWLIGYRRGGNGVARHQQTRQSAVENVRAVLDRDQARDLLVKVCEKLGFCLSSYEQERIVSRSPLTVYDFADAVFVGEGLDPATADKRLLDEVRAAVAAAFAKSSQPIEDNT